MAEYARFAGSHPRFLAFGFGLTFLSSFGQSYFVGVFGDAFQTAFALSPGRYGLVYSVATLLSGMCLIHLGRRLDDIDLRPYSAAIVVGMVAACVVIASATSWWVLLPGLFLLRLSGQGLMSHTAITTMARYFDRERGKAMAIAGLGFPAGEALLPGLGALAIGAIGWRGTWLTIAGGTVLLALPLALWLLRGHAARHAVWRTEHDAARADAVRNGAGSSDWTRGQVLRDPGFYFILPALLAPAFIVTGLFIHAGSLIAENGWSKTWWGACFIGFAAAQLPTGLLAGSLIDRLGARRLARALIVPLGLGLVVLGLTGHPGAALAFLVLAGVTSGVIGPVVGALWAELYGVTHLGAIRAMASSLMVFSTAGSPVGMGMLLDHGVTMRSIALASAAGVAVATGLLVVGLGRAGRK